MNFDEYVKEVLLICKEEYDKAQAPQEHKDLYENYPHMFVFSCVLDSQLDAERVWKIPLILAEELGGKEFYRFLEKDEEWYINFFNAKKLHRFNTMMAQAIYSAVQDIHNKWNDDASNMWKGKQSSAQVIYNFYKFKRVGIKIATMAANILSREYGIELGDYSAIDISPDVHVKRAMYRLGFRPYKEDIVLADIDPTMVVYRAKSLNPSFPGLMDLAFYNIGSKGICQNRKCNAGICPFGKICKKQGISDEKEN